jgi:hypothetical protein
MKFISLFIFQFALVLPSMAQSIEDLSKKEMKELLLKFSQSNDSLKKANLELSNQLNSALQKKGESELKNENLAKENNLLLEQVEALTKSQEISTRALKSNQATINQLQDSINKLYLVRDLSNGQFSAEEMAFITKSLREEIKKYQSGNEVSFVIKKAETTIVKLGTGDLGYVPAYEFNARYNPNFAGDFDKDGKQEILFTIDETAGGTYAWQRIFCLKVLPNNQYKLIELDYSCPCALNYHCGDNPYPVMTKVVNGNIYIHLACYGEHDASCCPSSETEKPYKFENDKLILTH